LTAYFFTYFVG